MYVEECGDCWHWKLGLNGGGYPQANIGGKQWLTARYIVQVLQGREIPAKHVVTTRCVNRLCLNPEHLIVARYGSVQKRTYNRGRRMQAGEYMARVRHFERMGRTVLDFEKAADIRSRPASVTNTELGIEFGCSPNAIRKARIGRSWKQQMPAASVFEWRPV
jgi:hypothetical protein